MDPSTLPPPEPCKVEYFGDAITRCVERSVTIQIPPSVDPAVLRRRKIGQRKFLAGAVLLPLGIGLGVTSSVPLIQSQDLDGHHTQPLVSVGASMAGLGVALIAIGAVLLTIGNRERAITAPEL